MTGSDGAGSVAETGGREGKRLVIRVLPGLRGVRVSYCRGWTRPQVPIWPDALFIHLVRAQLKCVEGEGRGLARRGFRLFSNSSESSRYWMPRVFSC